MRQIKDFLRLTSRHSVLIFVFSVILISALSLALSPHKVVNADGNTPRTDLPADIQCQIAAYDNSTGYLSQNCPGWSTNDLCDPYPAEPAGLDPGYFQWLTSQGADNGAIEQTQDGTAVVTPGTQSVYLDFDNLVYVCHHAVQGNVDYSTEAAPVSPYSIFEYDPATKELATTPTTLSLPTDQQYYISTTASSAYTSGNDPVLATGGVSFNNGTTVDIPSSTTSRFWRAGNMPFVVNLAKPLETSENIVVNIVAVPISEFPGDSPTCVNGGTYNPTGNIAGWHNTIFGLLYDGCETLTVTKTISITIPVQVQSNIFTVNQDGSDQQQVSGVTLFTCGYDSSQYRNTMNGFYYFTAEYGGGGTGYCNRILTTPFSSSSPAATYAPGAAPFISGYDGPYTRPFGTAGDTNAAYPSIATLGLGVCGPFGATNLQNHCPSSTYECQLAGLYSSTDSCGYHSLDRDPDSGEDFDYVSLKPPPCNGNSCPNPVAPTPSCTISTDPGTPEAYNEFSIKYKITNTAGETPLSFTTSGVPYGASISAPGIGSIPSPVAVIQPGASQSFSYTDSGGIAPGTYTITLTISSSNIGTLASCKDSFTVAFWPYLRAFGGDVITGTDSDYIDSCYDTAAGIESFNNNAAGGSNIGAGTNVADLATNPIEGFVSGQDNPNYSTLDPYSFANTPATTYGGSYGYSNQSCTGGDYPITGGDYYNAVKASANVSGSNVSQCPNSNTISGMNLTPGIGVGHQYICYSTHSIAITGPITYSGFTSTTNPAEMPVFEVVVYGGGITIDTTVDNVAGTYIAEHNPSSTDTDPANGNIYDTTNESVDTPASYNSTNTSIHDKLTVDGTFIANKLYLYRTNGSLSDNTSATGFDDQYDAEEFDYSPINWLAPANNPTLTPPPSNSIISLPPIF